MLLRNTCSSAAAAPDHLFISSQLMLHFPITHEQDPNIVKLVCLDEELRLGVANLHPNHFTICCKLPKCLQKVTDQRNQQKHINCKKQKRKRLLNQTHHQAVAAP